MLAEGIRFHELREWAASYWPQGFPADFSDDAFDALLSEMVGLGLLRDIRGTHVALRSANLAHLIGSKEKIDADLEVFADRPAPPEADPRRLGGSLVRGQACSPVSRKAYCSQTCDQTRVPASCPLSSAASRSRTSAPQRPPSARRSMVQNLPGHKQISVNNRLLRSIPKHPVGHKPQGRSRKARALDRQARHRLDNQFRLLLLLLRRPRFPPISSSDPHRLHRRCRPRLGVVRCAVTPVTARG